MTNIFVKRIATGPNYPQTVHEHRAPTDESVRLYTEMLAKAHRAVIERQTVSDNVFNFDYVVSYDLELNRRVLGVKLSLNGHEHVLVVPIDDSAVDTRDAALKNICDCLAGEILTKVLMSRKLLGGL